MHRRTFAVSDSAWNFWFTLAAILIFAGIALPGWLTRRRRARVAEQPLPDHWEEILEQSVPVYRQVPSDLRERYHDLIQNFLAEKSSEACGGLEEVSDPMRVTIAAYARLFLLEAKATLSETALDPRSIRAPTARDAELPVQRRP
ncbi:MAG: zinc-dependent peptidase [Verrucomicrobiales bacterium]